MVQATASVDYFRNQVEKLRAAAADQIEGDPVAVVELAAKRYRLTEAERNATLTHFLAGHAGGSQLTRYGLMQAITATSQSLDMPYSRATELEQLGGTILEMPRQDWRTLAAARRNRQPPPPPRGGGPYRPGGSMTEREKGFVEELAALLDRHRLTIEQHTCYDSTFYSEDWAFTGEDFDLDVCVVVEELDRRRGGAMRISR